MSTTTASNDRATAPDRPGVFAPPPVVYIVGLGVGFGLQVLLPATPLPAAVRWLLGGALLLAGLVLTVASFTAFRRAGTPANVFKATTALVTVGPYRVSRHPAYLALALIYVAIALMASALWVLVPLPAVLVVTDRCFIAREERYLERKFDGEYVRYKARTRRWL